MTRKFVRIEDTVDWTKPILATNHQIAARFAEMNLLSPAKGAEEPFPPGTRCTKCSKLIAGMYDHWCDVR